MIQNRFQALFHIQNLLCLDQNLILRASQLQAQNRLAIHRANLQVFLIQLVHHYQTQSVNLLRIHPHIQNQRETQTSIQ